MRGSTGSRLTLSRRAVGALAALLAAGTGEGRAAAGNAKPAANRVRAVAWIERITDSQATITARQAQPGRIEVCLREQFADGSRGKERCVAGGAAATRHTLQVDGLAAYATYQYTVWQLVDRAADAGPAPQRPGKLPFSTPRLVQTAPAPLPVPPRPAPKTESAAVDRLEFRESPSVVITGDRAGVRWSTSEFSNAWVDFTPVGRRGKTDPYAREQQFEIPTYGDRSVDGGLTRDHRICLTGVEPGRRYVFTARSALGKDRVVSEPDEFSLGGSEPSFGGGFRQTGAWRVNQPLTGLCALPGNRLLLLGPGGKVRVCRIDGSRLETAGGWTVRGDVADAALAPDGRLLLLSSDPGGAPGSEMSRVDIYRPDRGAGGGFSRAASITGLEGFPVTLAAATDGILVVFTGSIRADGIPESLMNFFEPDPASPTGYALIFRQPYGQVSQAVSGANRTIFLLSAARAILAINGGFAGAAPITIWTGKDLGAGAWITAAAIAADGQGNLVVADDCLGTLQQVAVTPRGVFTPRVAGSMPGSRVAAGGIDLTPQGDVLVLSPGPGNRSAIARYRPGDRG